MKKNIVYGWLVGFALTMPFAVNAKEICSNYTLNEDVSDGIIIKSGCDVTLDLANHNITNTNNNDTIIIESGAKATIKGNGKTTNTFNGKAVIKNDGTREAFNRDKILHGVMMAAQKRPISSEQLDALVDHVENEIRKQGLNEISSKDIGNLVMKELANLDDVAYIRFASIYRQFKDVSGFMEAMEDMMAKHDKE